MEYADEPRLIFSPLNEQDYCHFYNLEMADYEEDLPFFSDLLHIDDQVLELGCGTGRLTRLLAGSCKHITGIDRSVEMLKIAERNKYINITFTLMDMLALSFNVRFDAIIIPYNTINLLGNRADVERCLKLCSSCLSNNGRLAFQAYHPDIATQNTSENEKQFQFAIFDDHQNGKIIKETLKWYDRAKTTLNLEERYRVRPFGKNENKRDLRHTLKLYTPSFTLWNTLLQFCGFSVKHAFSSGSKESFSADRHSTLFIHAEKN